jgi:hypothetical protein
MPPTRSSRTTWSALALVLLVSALALAQGDSKTSHPKLAGFADLFAADLSNAELAPGSWGYEEGVLTAKDHGTIWTKKSYGNFILDLEFKVAPKANSGVFLRAGNTKDALSAFEIQVHETADGSKYGMVGALYDAKPPSKNMAKPAGEWNRYTITFQDNRLYLVFNGEQVLNVDLNDWPEARKNPDGTPNKFRTSLKDYPRSGPIGLQGIHGREGASVWYRNLKIKELN